MDLLAELESGAGLPQLQSAQRVLLRWNEKDVEDITASTLVGNGSKGDVHMNVRSNDYGVFPKMTAILVKDLVEFSKQSSGPQSAFGSVQGGYKAPEFSPKDGVEENTPDQEGPKKQEVKESKEEEDDIFDDFNV